MENIKNYKKWNKLKNHDYIQLRRLKVEHVEYVL